MQSNLWILIGTAAIMFAFIGGLSMLAHYDTLNGIKSKTVGDGQRGTTRWATEKEIAQTYKHIPFLPHACRNGNALSTAQELVLGSNGKKGAVTALVDADDIHCLMIGASGVGKTAYFLYPNLEYACAGGMSFLALDTKGDLARNYGAVAKDYSGYHVVVIDLRNPMRLDGNNLLSLVNHYMDIAQKNPDNISARAKTEEAEGLLCAVVLLLAEYLPPTADDPQERRHIISVFKLVHDLLGPSAKRGKSQFQVPMDLLPPTHKAHWFAGAALNSAEQTMASAISTVLSRLNAFLDSGL